MLPLEKFKKRSISVSDIASQFWCEKKLELTYLFGKKISEEQKKGKEFHQELEREVERVVDIEPINYADYLFIKFFNLSKTLEHLEKEGIAREIPIFGSIEGFFITGQIDEIQRKEGKNFIIETKTRTTSLPAGDFLRKVIKVQLFLYKKLLEDSSFGNFSLKNVNNFFGLNKLKLSEGFIRQLKANGIEEKELIEVAREAYEKILHIGEISKKLEVIYVDQYTGKNLKKETFVFDEEEFKEMMKFAFAYWKGKREALPVPKEEVQKCLSCRFFGKECKFWYLKV
jgi:exonuclease V